MLNVVYKIGSACIANRLKAVLPTLINEDQTGFIKNRYIGDNIRLIYDLIDYLQTFNKPGVLICLDFEKAFDSLSWTFMFKVLKAFGFGPDFRKWIETFYKNIKSTVTVNGKLTPWFQVKRGCRQGDPISPYLFVLCAEIFAIMIRQNEKIKGIKIGGMENKISQYADDTELMQEGDRKSFEEAIRMIDMFGNVSGLKLHAEKSSAIWLGSKKNSRVIYMPHLQMKWNPEHFKILGIWFTSDLNQCVKINSEQKFRDTNSLLDMVKETINTHWPSGSIKVFDFIKNSFLWLLLPNPPDDIVNAIQKGIYQFV